MIIGLDGSRAFLKYRTGIEEYSYQVVKHLRDCVPENTQVRIYVRKKIAFDKKRKFYWKLPDIDFTLPGQWELVGLWAPRFWTQIRLSLEMLSRPVDTLLIPAHTVPVIHPLDTVVVVHGLEYEMSPKSYSLWERFYMRTSIKYSVRVAKKVIAVSENTKSDLQKLYRVPAEKIRVISEGFLKSEVLGGTKHNTILFVGRLEERKNILRIIDAFEKIQEQSSGRYQLILAGKAGYGHEAIQKKINQSKWKEDIQELGYVSTEQKNKLLNEAKLFFFPSLYEGFGLPILEAQARGTAVLTSKTSSLPEVAGDGAWYVNPSDVSEMVEKLQKILTLPESEYREIVEKGYKNLERFSWEKCAQNIARELV